MNPSQVARRIVLRGGAPSAGGGNVVVPAVFPLELVSPRAAGSYPSSDTGTPAMPSGHRIFKAYPGIAYNIRPVVIAGSYPYTFSLSDAPTGMTIDASTGEINWPNPTGTTVTPTITVTDAEGTVESSAWTITITTSGFRFIDAVSGDDSNTGTLAAPWRTLAKVKSSSSAGDICYFLDGTYTTDGIAVDNSGGYTAEFTPLGNWRRLEWSGSTRSVQWLAYPGHSPVISQGYVAGTSQGVIQRIQGSATYPICLDGIAFTDAWFMQLQVAGTFDYDCFHRLNMYGVAWTIDGQNSGCIDSISSVGSKARYYVSYIGNRFHDNLVGGAKIYWQYKSLLADNEFVDNGGSSVANTGRAQDISSGGPDHKAVCARFEVRRNLYRNNPSSSDVPDNNGATCDAGFGGNMNSGDDGSDPASTVASGEVRYNRFDCAARPGLRVVNMNNFSNAGEIHIYRNTGIGRWNVENSDNGTGPFRFYNNVIINDTGVDAYDRITVSGSVPGNRTLIELGSGAQANIKGATNAGIVDANLNLQGSYRASYLGTHGHEIP